MSFHDLMGEASTTNRLKSRLLDLADTRTTWFAGGLFFAFLLLQAIGFGLLGIGRAGMGLSESMLVLHGVLSLACSVSAFRRAQGTTALFWILFATVMTVLFVPTAIQAYGTLCARSVLSESTWRLIYCLYGAPILMMFFLPEARGDARARLEVFLDLLQVAIVVSLIYATFFFFPAQSMLPSDALLHNVSVSDAQSLLLLVAAFLRLQFCRTPETRGLLLRLTFFLLACAITTFVGDWIDLHQHAWSPWFDLGWAVPFIVAGLIALTWRPAPQPTSLPESASFLNFVVANLALVTMLLGVALLTNHWEQAYGRLLTSVAIVASLLALTLRLALTQFHQQQEIRHRQAAQNLLAVSHEEIAQLLDQARAQTLEITEVSQLGNLLQACNSRAQVFQLLPSRMVRLFPGTSGALSMFNVSRTRAEPVAVWGERPPSDHHLAWGVRSGSQSVSAPLITNGEALGVLVLGVDEDSPTSRSEAEADGDSSHRQQLALAIAKQIALTVSNIDLREALQDQAIRDPLTGLYNRRYMQEFLDREVRRARRRERSLAVMMIDIDHFKRYNDSFGHGAGDDALRLVGETLMDAVRAEDLACRYGGEEFTVILVECSLAQAVLRAEEICRRLRQIHTNRPGELPEGVTASIGVAGFPETTDNIDLLVKVADQGLYQAKHDGRDRVVAANLEATSAVAPSLSHSSDLSALVAPEPS
ncbi:MAG: GGDEF domain-containing protein [Acidobacteria bacterium]|nr:GGDEF domain-containing protein [Acidobacteriota bacterium]